MDILKELPSEQWPVLQQKLKLLWPINLPGYYTLHVNSKYPGVREAFKFKVYCPHGDMNNGFVAISIKNDQDIIICSLTDDTSKIEEALMKTELIDWSKRVNFSSVTAVTLPCIERLQDVMRFESFLVAGAEMYHLPGTTELFKDFKLPDKTVVKSVKLENIQQVDNKWPFKYPNSVVYFATLTSNGLSYGLYSCDTDELLAWIFINEYNYLCHLYCEEKHRRRGYGQYVTQCAVNNLLKDGNDVYCYVASGNEMPLALLAKFGFKVIYNAAFVIINNFANKV